MLKVNVLIPTFNLRERGYERINNLVYSLHKQTIKPDKVIIIDGSNRANHRELLTALNKDALVLWREQTEFNMPELLSVGSDFECDYICTTGADFIFKNDLIETYMKNQDGNSFIMKQCRHLPKLTNMKHRIDNWDFPDGKTCHRLIRKKGRSYLYGLDENGLLSKEGNGAFQMSPYKWFKKNVLPDKNMPGLGAYDWYMMLKAKEDGLNIKWVQESEIMHQFHRFNTMKFSEKFKENQQFVNARFAL